MANLSRRPAINVAIGGKCAGQEVFPRCGANWPLLRLIVKNSIHGDPCHPVVDIADYEWRQFAIEDHRQVIEACVPHGVDDEEATRLVLDHLNPGPKVGGEARVAAILEEMRLANAAIN